MMNYNRKANNIQLAHTTSNTERLHRCTVLQLRKLAKQRGIQKTEKMRRTDLLHALQSVSSTSSSQPALYKNRVGNNYTMQRVALMKRKMTAAQKQQKVAAAKILKWWRHWKNIRKLEDPITLDGIQGQPYIFVSKNHPYLKYTFGATSLSTYVIESLNFDNPLTREPLNSNEIARLSRLSGNPETLKAYHNRYMLAEQRELTVSAMKSCEWDVEECVNTAFMEGEYLTDQNGIADNRDVQDLIYELETELFPEMAMALKKLLHYETLPRMESQAAHSLAKKIIEKIKQKSNEPPYVDERILQVLLNFFEKFLIHGLASLRHIRPTMLTPLPMFIPLLTLPEIFDSIFTRQLTLIQNYP